MARQGAIGDLSTKYRWSVRYGLLNKQPEMRGSSSSTRPEAARLFSSTSGQGLRIMTKAPKPAENKAFPEPKPAEIKEAPRRGRQGRDQGVHQGRLYRRRQRGLWRQRRRDAALHRRARGRPPAGSRRPAGRRPGDLLNGKGDHARSGTLTEAQIAGLLEVERSGKNRTEHRQADVQAARHQVALRGDERRPGLHQRHDQHHARCVAREGAAVLLPRRPNHQEGKCRLSQDALSAAPSRATGDRRLREDPRPDADRRRRGC
jgi:hypothetical protein